MITVSITILLATLTGVALVRVLSPELHGPTRAGAAILVGFGYIGLTLFGLSVAGLPWSRTAVLVALLVPLICFRIPVRATAASWVSRWGSHCWVDVVVLLLVVGHAIYATWAPMYEWDWFGIWGLKARTFFDAHGVAWHALRSHISHPDYPLLVPLLVDLPSLLRGAWGDRYVGLLYTALCSGFILIARGLLAEELESEWLAAVGTLAIASPALNLWIGLAEGPVMAYGCAGLLFIRRGLTRGSDSSMRLGAILLGLAAWCKNEGLALTGMAILAVLVVARRRAWRMWPAVAIPGVWIAARVLLRLRTGILRGDVLARLGLHVRELGAFFRALWVYAPDLGWFWIATLLTLIVFARRIWRGERFLALTLLSQTFLLAAQALVARVDASVQVEYSWNRLPHQIAPAFGFLAVVLLIPAARGGAGDARAASP